MFFVISFQAFSDHSSECYVTIFHVESLKNRNLKLKISTLALSFDSKIAWKSSEFWLKSVYQPWLQVMQVTIEKKCLGDEDVST